MSLQYIIDGYNLINHPLFAQVHKKSQDPRLSLLEFIRTKKPCGSSKNKVIVIFDGYPAPSFKSGYDCPGIDVVFSKGITADQKIKAMLEKATNCRVVIVVSDDNEIKFFARSYRAKAMGIEEFVKSAIPDASDVSRKGKLKTQKSDLLKPELTYVQISKINKELKSLWLK